MPLTDFSFRPPVLQTERLVLRGYEPSDAPAVFAYGSDVEATRFMFWDRAQSLDDTVRFLDVVVAASYEKQELDYVITLRGQEQRAVGGMGVFWRSRQHRIMELGYIMHRDCWGRGLVPEAGRALLRHAFATTDVERIFAPICAENQRSRRAAEKMGMRFEGVFRSSLELRGRRWDQAVYAILRGELG